MKLCDAPEVTAVRESACAARGDRDVGFFTDAKAFDDIVLLGLATRERSLVITIPHADYDGLKLARLLDFQGAPMTHELQQDLQRIKEKYGMPAADNEAGTSPQETEMEASKKQPPAKGSGPARAASAAAEQSFHVERRAASVARPAGERTMDTSPHAVEHVNPPTLAEAMAEVDSLKAKINLMQREFELEQNGAFAFITALVLKLGGTVELSNVDMMEACEHEMERGDRPDGGFVIRASKPIVVAEPTLAQVQ